MRIDEIKGKVIKIRRLRKEMFDRLYPHYKQAAYAALQVACKDDLCKEEFNEVSPEHPVWEVLETNAEQIGELVWELKEIEDEALKLRSDLYTYWIPEGEDMDKDMVDTLKEIEEFIGEPFGVQEDAEQALNEVIDACEAALESLMSEENAERHAYHILLES